MNRTLRIYVHPKENEYIFTAHLLINNIRTGFCAYCKNWYEVLQAAILYNATIADVILER